MSKLLFRRLIIGVALLIAAATGPTLSAADQPVSIDLVQMASQAKSLDGRQISVVGFVLMSEESRNVVSKLDDVEGQVCVGLLVTEDAFKKLKRHHLRKSRVTGRFDKEGCGGLTICHDSCGPYAILDPEITPLN